MKVKKIQIKLGYAIWKAFWIATVIYLLHNCCVGKITITLNP